MSKYVSGVLGTLIATALVVVCGEHNPVICGALGFSMACTAIFMEDMFK